MTFTTKVEKPTSFHVIAITSQYSLRATSIKPTNPTVHPSSLPPSFHSSFFSSFPPSHPFFLTSCISILLNACCFDVGPSGLIRWLIHHFSATILFVFLFFCGVFKRFIFEPFSPVFHFSYHKIILRDTYFSWRKKIFYFMDDIFFSYISGFYSVIALTLLRVSF